MKTGRNITDNSTDDDSANDICVTDNETAENDVTDNDGTDDCTADDNTTDDNTTGNSATCSCATDINTTGKTLTGKTIHKKKRFFNFYVVLLLILGLFLVAIGIGTKYFWEYIEAFENSRIDYIIERLQENVDYDFWQLSVENAIKSRLTEFESDGPVPISPYLSKIRDVPYILRQNSEESQPEAPVYTIRAGARDIGFVRLVPTDNIGYDFYLWDVDSIEFLDSFIESFDRSISITASHNAQVTVNGVLVSDGYRVDCDYDYGATYQIDGIYGDVEVSVVEITGSQSDPYHAEGGWYFYPILQPFSRDYNFIVPEDALVLADGRQVGFENVTDDRIVPAALVGVLDLEDVPTHLHRYEFSLDELYFEPVVTVVGASGHELQPGVSDSGDMLYLDDYSEQYKELYSDVAETFIRAYVNYTANIGGNIGGNLTNLCSYILRSSELYQRVQASRDAMIWVGATTVTYNSLEIEKFRAYGDSYFSCEVSYNIANRTPYGVRDMISSFELLFVYSGDRWLAIHMAAL